MVTVLPPGELEPSDFGLVNSRTLAGGSERWQSGFTQESVACEADVTLIDVCNNELEEDLWDRVDDLTNGEFLPYGVKATVRCSVMGGLRSDWDARVLAALERCHYKAVELEFWEGRLAQAANVDDPGSNPNRYLANGDAVDVNAAGAVKARYGLALLEGKIASIGCGGKGWIHMPRSIASVLPLKADDDGILRTMLGNYVVAGDGYTGAGTGATTTTKWMYATGPVSVHMDAPEVVGLPAQNINVSTNSIEVSAERLAAATWDGCIHIGVRVDLTLDYA